MGIKKTWMLLAFALFIGGLPLLHAQPKPFKKEYRVVLTLPFKSKSSSLNTLSEAMFDYYQGVKTALTQLEEEGLNMKLYVFDAAKDSQSLDHVLSHPDVAKADLFIGPVYGQELKKVEAFCKDHQIPLVSPLKYYPSTIKGLNLMNFFPDDTLKTMTIALQTAKLFPKHKIYIVTDNTPTSTLWANHLKKGLQLGGYQKSKNLVLNQHKFSGAAPKGDSIIYLSAIPGVADRTYLQNQLKNKYASWVIGHHDWVENTTSTFDLDHEFVIYPDLNHINYGDSATKIFRSYFREHYKGEPSKYAFIGYDQMRYLAYHLMAFGALNVESKSLNGGQYHGLINCIGFVPSVKKNSGFDNMGVHFLLIRDGKFEPMNP